MWYYVQQKRKVYQIYSFIIFVDCPSINLLTKYLFIAQVKAYWG